MTIIAFSYDMIMPSCLSQKYDASGKSKEVFQVISSRIKISCLLQRDVISCNVKEEAIYSFQLSPSDVCVHNFFYSLLLLLPHSSIHFQLRATTVVSELAIQVTAKLSKKQVDVALASYGCKHFHLTLRRKVKNTPRKLDTTIIYKKHMKGCFLPQLDSGNDEHTFKKFISLVRTFI